MVVLTGSTKFTRPCSHKILQIKQKVVQYNEKSPFPYQIKSNQTKTWVSRKANVLHTRKYGICILRKTLQCVQLSTIECNAMMQWNEDAFNNSTPLHLTKHIFSRWACIVHRQAFAHSLIIMIIENQLNWVPDTKAGPLCLETPLHWPLQLPIPKQTAINTINHTDITTIPLQTNQTLNHISTITQRLQK